jgi:hypothetical protein
LLLSESQPEEDLVDPNAPKPSSLDHQVDQLKASFIALLDHLAARATGRRHEEAEPGDQAPERADGRFARLGDRMARYPLATIGVAMVTAYVVARMVRRR